MPSYTGHIRLAGIFSRAIHSASKLERHFYDLIVLDFRITCESQGPDLNRRWAALQAAAFGRTLPPWRILFLLLRSFKRSGTEQPVSEIVP